MARSPIPMRLCKVRARNSRSRSRRRAFVQKRSCDPKRCREKDGSGNQGAGDPEEGGEELTVAAFAFAFCRSPASSSVVVAASQADDGGRASSEPRRASPTRSRATCNSRRWSDDGRRDGEAGSGTRCKRDTSSLSLVRRVETVAASLRSSKKSTKATDMDGQPAPASVVLQTGRQAGTSASLALHPLPILSISDHLTRARVQAGPDSAGVRVYGALLGTQTARDVEIHNTFEIKVANVPDGQGEGSRPAQVDLAFFRSRQAQCE